MKLFAINGSPRKNGNTATLLQKALEGAAAQGAETEMIHLYDLDYRGCISCFACKRKGGEYGKCVVRDDLAPILEKMKTADAIIFGSPIYFLNITSGMSAFLERLLFSNYIYSLEIPTVFPKKIPTGFIYTMNATRENMEKFGVPANLSGYRLFMERILGRDPQTLFAYNTYQFPDYEKYESSMFSEKDKARQRVEQFPLDCENAFSMGAELMENSSAN